MSTNMAGRKRTVSDRELLLVFEEADDPVLSAPEVANRLPIGKTGTYKRLRDLQGRGLLTSKKIGQGRAWWITDQGREFLTQGSN
jgi:CTP-dependent riboflavin kinase